MIRRFFHRMFLPTVVLALVALFSAMARAAGPSRAPTRQGEAIVRCRTVESSGLRKSDEAPTFPARLAQIGERYGLRAKRSLADTALRASGLRGAAPSASPAARATWLLRFAPDVDLDAILEAFAADPEVFYAEPNCIGSLLRVPSDPLYPQTRGDLSLIGAEAAWDVQPGASGELTVAIVDSGIDPFHPDLRDAVDLERSRNFADLNSLVYDDIGHGTRVAGIIGATSGNGEGIAGLAAGCRLLSLDVATSTGAIAASDVAEAIRWAIECDARIVNMSLGFMEPSRAIEDACREAAEAGALLVASAGNGGQGKDAIYPAACDGVIGVAALADDGIARAPWSNFNGSRLDLVELAAPGSTVYSTIPGSQYEGRYGSGTSFAAPMVSGIAALLMSKSPEQSSGAVRAHLRRCAQPLGDWAGFGRLDGARALHDAMEPAVAIGEARINDAPALSPANDGDGRFDCGETVQVLVRLINRGADISALSATLSSPDADIGIGADQFFAGPLEYNADAIDTEVSDALVFGRIVCAQAVPGAKTARMNLRLTGNRNTFRVDLVFDIAIENTFTPLSDVIDGPVTWTADKTYRIERPTVVRDEGRLTIEPGTTVLFGPGGTLHVRSQIAALGTAEKPIVFTAEDSEPIGGWGEPLSFRVHEPIRSLAVGDVDGDGDCDIATLRDLTNSAGGSLVVLRHHEGDFADQRWISLAGSGTLGGQPRAVAIGDTNNDGIAEIVVTNTMSRKLAVAKWNGSKFAVTWLTIKDSDSLQEVAIGDVDHDGLNEIVLTDLPTSIRSSAGSRVGIVRWNGSDAATVEWVEVCDDPEALCLGDADNDGDVDIAVASAQSRAISLVRWRGDRFEELPVHAVLEAPHSIWIGPLMDNPNNVIAAANRDSNSVSIYSWHDSEFRIEENYFVGEGPECVVTGDVDNDGDGDILVANGASRDLSLLRFHGVKYMAERRLFGEMKSDWAGFEELSIHDATGDGCADLVAIHADEGTVFVFPWRRDLSGLEKYEPLRMTGDAISVRFAHCRFEFSSVLNESNFASFTDCVSDRAGGLYALKTTGVHSPLERCRAIGNDGGGGIAARALTLLDCVAEDCATTGLLGGRMERSTAIGNGAGGMQGAMAKNCVATGNGASGIAVGETANDCLASGNGAWGIVARGDVSYSTATWNLGGIKSESADHCTARQNADVGIEAEYSVSDCLAENNGGIGIEGGYLRDCIIARNGAGLRLEGMAWRCTVAENDGVGVRDATVLASVVAYNNGAGASNSPSLSNSWVLGNNGTGVHSPLRVENCVIAQNTGIGVDGLVQIASGFVEAPHTELLNSTIRQNGSYGVRNAWRMRWCNLYDNDDALGYDYFESRRSDRFEVADLSQNFWGLATTAQMDANADRPGSDIDRIYDFYDDGVLCEALWANYLPFEAVASTPDATAPGFLLSAEPIPDSPVGVGRTTFTLVFNKPMDTSKPLSVTFGLAEPFMAHVVEPASGAGGWVGPKTWVGSHAIDSGTGQGRNTLRVAAGVAKDGFALPDDTAHRFVIDFGEPGANNGLVIGGSSTGLRLEWKKDTQSTTIGYNVLRADGEPPYSYKKINARLIVAPVEPFGALRELRQEASDAPVIFEDRNVELGVAYFYIVYTVDSDFQSFQYTKPEWAVWETPGEDKAAVETWDAFR